MIGRVPLSPPTMHKHSLLMLFLAGGLPAQQFTETFPFPDGPLIPGWTQQTSAWVVKNQRVTQTSGAVWSYLTLDAFPNLAACAVDVDVYFPTTPILCFGGPCARHPGGSGSVGQVMAKVQGSASFNIFYVYEQPGSAVSSSLAATPSATMRLIVRGRTAWSMVDTNMDGIFDSTTLQRVFAATTTKDRGLAGIDAYNTAEMDNFKLYDAVLQADATTLPKIGTTYKMSFTAELVNGLPTPWIVALSLGKAGIPVLGGRQLPLTLDPLFNASLGFGMSGLLQTSAPDGTASISLPGDPALVGLRVFAAGVTIDGSKPLAIGAISNDHTFVITS